MQGGALLPGDVGKPCGDAGWAMTADLFETLAQCGLHEIGAVAAVEYGRNRHIRDGRTGLADHGLEPAGADIGRPARRAPPRSGERRVGNAWVSTCRTRCSPSHKKTKKQH